MINLCIINSELEKLNFINMKIKFYLILFVLVINYSCDDDNSNVSRASNKIDITIDGSSNPLDYSYNLLAEDIPVPASTGFSCGFKISSEDVSNQVFYINFLPTINSCPYTISLPNTSTISGTSMGNLSIQGIDIDYSHSGNALTMTITNFGTTSGSDITLTISGTFYDTLGNSHTILIDIDITKS